MCHKPYRDIEKKEHNRLLNIFNKLPIFINILDNNGNIVECNDFVKERLGYSEVEIINRDLLEEMVKDESGHNNG